MEKSGNDYSILGSYWDNGNENGNYYVSALEAPCLPNATKSDKIQRQKNCVRKKLSLSKPCLSTGSHKKHTIDKDKRVCASAR